MQEDTVDGRTGDVIIGGESEEEPAGTLQLLPSKVLWPACRTVAGDHASVEPIPEGHTGAWLVAGRRRAGVVARMVCCPAFDRAMKLVIRCGNSVVTLVGVSFTFTDGL